MEIFGREIKLPFSGEKEYVSIFNVSRKQPDVVREIKRVAVPRVLPRRKQDIGTWRKATIAAERLLHPNRTQLLTLYKDVDLDAHLTAIIQVRKNAILGSEFIVVDEKGETDDKKTALLQKKWFRKFVDLSLDSKWWGYSLIQFGDLENDVFEDVHLCPRHFVKQEKSLIVEHLALNEGVNYEEEEPYKDWYIGVGEKRDLGLYLKAAPHVMWKRDAMGSSSEFLEIYGAPIRILKTDTKDAPTRADAENMLKQMGSSAWGVIDHTDDLELHSGNTSSSNDKLFDTPIIRANSEMSKLILGQTGTTDEKSFTGSAVVHEKILGSVKDSDVKFIEDVFSRQLVPLMNAQGMGFENRTIKIKEDDALTLEQKSKIDLELLDHYDIEPEYIEQTYGVPVKEKQPEEGSPKDIQNQLKKIYGPDGEKL